MNGCSKAFCESSTFLFACLEEAVLLACFILIAIALPLSVCRSIDRVV